MLMTNRLNAWAYGYVDSKGSNPKWGNQFHYMKPDNTVEIDAIVDAYDVASQRLGVQVYS